MRFNVGERVLVDAKVTNINRIFEYIEFGVKDVQKYHGRVGVVAEGDGRDRKGLVWVHFGDEGCKRLFPIVYLRLPPVTCVGSLVRVTRTSAHLIQDCQELDINPPLAHLGDVGEVVQINDVGRGSVVRVQFDNSDRLWVPLSCLYQKQMQSKDILPSSDRGPQSSESATCLGCGQPNRKDAKFCDECGFALGFKDLSSAGTTKVHYLVCEDAACRQQNPLHSRFCGACGNSLLDLHQSGAEEPAHNDDMLVMMGFRIGNGLLRSSSAEWSLFSEVRKRIQQSQQGHLKYEVCIVKADDVYFTQQWCSDCFRNGVSLSQTKQQLLDGHLHPLKSDFLILDVLQAFVRPNQGYHRSLVYYTLDHRRLKCMKDAGCTHVRVRIVAQSGALDEFINKGIPSLGMRSDIVVKKRRVDDDCSAYQ